MAKQQPSSGRAVAKLHCKPSSQNCPSFTPPLQFVLECKAKVIRANGIRLHWGCESLIRTIYCCGEIWGCQGLPFVLFGAAIPARIQIFLDNHCVAVVLCSNF